MIRRKLLLVAALFLAGLVLLEGFARFYVLPRYWRPLPPYGAVTNERQRDWVERQKAELEGEAPRGVGRFDARLGWAYRRSSRSPDGSTSIQSRGWRGPREYARSCPEGTLRVATFGDSFTFCEEVSDGDTWQVQLEALRPDWEVLNLGVGGYGTDQALLRARGELAELDADVLVVGLLLENIGRNVNRYRPLWYPNADSAAAKPRFVLTEEGLVLVPQPFATRAELIEAIEGGFDPNAWEHEYWARSWVPRGLGSLALGRLWGAQRAYAARELPRLWSDPQGEPFRTTVAILEAFAALGVENEVPTLVLLFPIASDLSAGRKADGPYWRTLTAALGAAGQPYLDLAEPLAALQSQGEALYTGSHLSPRGNRIVAEAVGGKLAALVQHER